MRTHAHIIDTRAIKATIAAIPEHWVVRELTERDYGIDLMVEIFNQIGEDKNGHLEYDASGWICYLQVKGTGNEHTELADGSWSLPVKKKALRYIEKFATPFFLVRTVATDKIHEIRFVWMQRYISDYLDFNCPDWRKSDTESVSIHLPGYNSLPKYSRKIEWISLRVKYNEEQIEYQERLDNIERLYESVDSNKPNEVTSLLNEVTRITRLTTLLTNNGGWVTVDTISELESFIRYGLSSTPRPKLNSFPEYDHLLQLANDHKYRISSENAAAEADDETVY